LGSAVLLASLAAGFLPQQCIWTDEVTQLKGLTLSPVELVPWLYGVDPGRFGVVPETAPPLSYWCGMAWSAVFGLSETSLRWMGLVMVAVAAGVVARTAGRLGGFAGSVAGGLWFALSPNIITAAVEIRPYPLFILTSACSFYAFTRIVSEPRTYAAKWAVWLSVFLIASLYTHFFGLVLSGSLWTACLLLVRLKRGPLRPLLLPAAVTGLMALGLAPFVRWSFEMSGTDAFSGSLFRDTCRLLYRFVGHPALAMSVLANVTACIGFVVVILIALLQRQPSGWTVFALACALASGLGVTVLAAARSHALETLSPRYSLWAFPGLAILASTVVLAKGSAFRTAGVAALTLVLSSFVFADVELEARGTLFAHGPHRRLSSLVRQYQSPGFLVVYEDEEAGIGYFPLLYDFGVALPQYKIISEDSLLIAPIAPTGRIGAPIPLEGEHPLRLMVVHAEWKSGDELRRHLRDRKAFLQPGRLASRLLRSPEWHLVESEEIVATSSALVHIFER
jgi:hypothetical protein